MVKPGGTGSPRFAISARLAPLPPSRSRITALPSALPPPKEYTHLAAGALAGAGLMAEGLDREGLGATRFTLTRGAPIADGREAARRLRAGAFFKPAATFGRLVFWATRDAFLSGRRLRTGLIDFAMTMSHAFSIPDKARSAWPCNSAFRQGAINEYAGPGP